MEGVKVVAKEEQDGRFAPNEGHVLCRECEGRGTQTCDDCRGDGRQTHECEMGYEHTEDCASCDEGLVDCFDCDGQGEILDPDLELDDHTL